MCHIGGGKTHTPFHKDLCAASGHNLMCYAKPDAAAFWFMTSASDSPELVAWFHDKFENELEHNIRVLTLEELADAPVPKIFITEQKPGDLVLIPPRGCYQVINNHSLNIKMAWSRMSLHGLATALHCELPIYRRCRKFYFFIFYLYTNFI